KVRGERVLRHNVGSRRPAVSIGEESCGDAGGGLQRVERDRPIEAELFTRLADGGLMRALARLTAAGDCLPDVHVLAAQNSEFDLLTDPAERYDEDLEWCSGHVTLLGQESDGTGGVAR